MVANRRIRRNTELLKCVTNASELLRCAVVRKVSGDQTEFGRGCAGSQCRDRFLKPRRAGRLAEMEVVHNNERKISGRCRIVRPEPTGPQTKRQ